jgi:hypothetical protein
MNGLELRGKVINKKNWIFHPPLFFFLNNAQMAPKSHYDIFDFKQKVLLKRCQNLYLVDCRCANAYLIIQISKRYQ